MSDELITTTEFARRLAARLGREKPFTRFAVKNWIDTGLLSASKTETGRGPLWQIPAGLVETFTPPKIPGRPKGSGKPKPEAVNA